MYIIKRGVVQVWYKLFNLHIIWYNPVNNACITLTYLVKRLSEIVTNNNNQNESLRSRLARLSVITERIFYKSLSHDVPPGSDITPCNKIDKPLVVYRLVV